MVRLRGFWSLFCAAILAGPASAATVVTVYRDYNGNGTRDAGEPGVVGATATAFSSTGATVSGTTGNDGTVSLSTADGQHRVEVAAPGVLRMGAAGTSGVRSDVQFGTDPAGAGNLTLSFAASNPAQYCNSPANADLLAVRNVREQLAGTTAQVSVSSWDYLADATSAIGTQTTWAVDQSSTEPAVVGTGAQWGLAYRRRGDVAFSAAFVRTASPLGGSLAEESTGNIYAHTRSASGVITTSRFLDLNAAAFGAIDLGPNPHSRSVVSNFDTLPLAGRDVVGKVGLGDIDISEDESTLYAVNLFQKELLVIPLGAAQAPSAPTTEAQISRIVIPRPSNCANADDFRPFALGIHDGVVYVGAVCTAQNVAPTNDPFDSTRRAAMRAYVLQLNQAGTAFNGTPLLDFQLNYPRRFANDGADFSDSGKWLPWTDNPAYPGTGHGSAAFYSYPQAILSDLAFDGFGFLTLAFTDRLTLQAFDSPPGDGPGEEDTRYAGEMLLACENGSGGFNIENNGSCSARGVTRTAQDPNNDGISSNGTGIGSQDDNQGSGPGTTRGGVEFYFGERYNYTLSTPAAQSAMNGPDYHRESATGALAILGGQGSVVTTVYDVGGTFNNGTRVMNNGNLTPTNTGLMYRTGGYMPAPDSPTANDQFHEFRLISGDVSFGKGNGLGDIEVICETSQPIEIGNRIWIDEDADGIQDPEEPGLAGVNVQLRNAAGTQIGQATTDANGNYLFILTEIIGTETDPSPSDASVILPFANLYSQTVSVSISGTTTSGLGTGGAGNVPASYRATTANATSGAGSDNRDSEGVILTSPAVPSSRVGASLTLPASAGASTYTVDFGFVPSDFGDLPDSGPGVGSGNYETLFTSGGAHNLMATNLRLGTSVGTLSAGYDYEDAVVQNAAATGDDTNGVDDENGLTSPPAGLRQGVSPTVTLSVFNNTGATRNLCGYLDFNNNGVFDAPGEVVATTVSSSAVPQDLPFAFAGSISASETFANNNLYGRFRVQEAACSPNGYGGAGEVEDYAFPVSEVGVTVSAIPDFCPGQSVVFTITLTNAASRATATNFPVTADLVGADEANLAGIPSFADANWAVTSTTGGATLATSTGDGVDINTTATLPANSSVVITVQATVANGVSLARSVAAEVRPAAGSVDALASNDTGSGSSTLGTCPVTSGRGALCPATTSLPALSASAANTVVNGYWAGAATVTASPSASNPIGRCVQVGTLAAAAGTGTIASGDLLLLIQMQGATIDSTDAASYGDGVANSPGGATAAIAGTHEYLIAQGPVQAIGAAATPCAGLANVIEVAGAGVAGGVINSYAHDPSPAGGGRSTFQVVLIPRYGSITFSGSGSLTAPAWNGLTGGVLVVDVTGTVDLGGGTTTRFDAAGLGFRGGVCEPHSGTSTSNTTLFRLPASSTTNARKGEGYAGTSCGLANVPACTTLQGYPNGDDGKGAPGSAGGGGQHCVDLWATGGGGGAGGGVGGSGGTAGATGCNVANISGHGGGILPTANSSAARLVLGGGGGAGARQAGLPNSNGGRGGGIVVVRANAIISASGTPAINASGNVGLPTTGISAVAGGGGGGGGTVMLLTNLAGGTSYANTVVSVNGGAGGAAAVFANPVNNDGSGGGGGGGRLFVAATAATPGGTRTILAGAAGTGGNRGQSGSDGITSLGLDPVNASPGVKPGFVCDNSSTVPVTIAQVESRNLGSELEVRFVTASEAGTLGYHVYADGDAGRTRLSRELVLATSDRGLEKQEYVVRGPQLGATSVTIEEVDLSGKSSFYGPYPLDRSVGERDFTQATDWGAIRSELSAWQSARITDLRAQGGSAVAELGVSADGWYRVTGAALQAAGVDLTGVPVAELGLFVGTTPVPMQVEGGATVGPTTALSFYGRAVVDNLYTTRQVYRLQRQAGPRLMPAAVASGTGSVTRYVHVERQAPNLLYSFSSPLADPWYASRIVRQGTTSPTSVYTLPVSERESGEAEVVVTLYGGTDLPGEAADHHAVLRVNGQTVASAVFDGLAARTLRATVDAALLTANTTVEVGFGETPYSVDVLHIESVELRYPRRTVLQSGELRMAAVASTGGEQLLRSGFETTDTACTGCGATEYVVTGVNPGQPLQVLRLEPTGAVSLVGVTREGGSVRFAATGGEGVELLVTQQVRSATVEAGRVPANLLTGSAKLLVIAHASFLESPQSQLNRLLQARQAEGLSTKVVDVQDLYRAYSGGVTDARAIAAYIREAVTALGTRYVLLVGGDTYDYGNHLNLGSVSFVPTLYTPTSPFVRFAPADGMLADLDGDRRANIAVGRLPVRTVAELNRMVDRILSPAAGTTALLVSDREQAGYRYSEQNDLITSGLPASWTRTHLKLDSVPQGQAGTLRQQLVAALGQGQSLLSWYGHSSPSTWSREGLLTAPQVYGGLLTHTSPTTVVQWGCWGAYFVDPRYNTLAHAFLLNASGGAASFIGATALTETVSDTALGERLKPLLAEPVRIGDALLEATLALPPGPFDDVTVGTVILGDPSARIRR